MVEVRSNALTRKGSVFVPVYRESGILLEKRWKNYKIPLPEGLPLPKIVPGATRVRSFRI